MHSKSAFDVSKALFSYLHIARGQFDKEIDVVRLDLGFVCCAIASDLAAFIAFMDDDISFFGIGFHADGAQDPAASICAVSGVDIHMKRTKAFGAMVAGAIPERLYFKSAVFADEGIVVFGESFLFHGVSFLYHSKFAN